MRKIISLLLAVVLGGCASITQGGVTQRYFSLQQAALVRVVNNCAPSLKVESIDGVINPSIKYGHSFTAVLVRQPFSSNSLVLTVEGFDGNRYLGSSTRTYYVDANQGANQYVWEVTSIQTSSGDGCLR